MPICTVSACDTPLIWACAEGYYVGVQLPNEGDKAMSYVLNRSGRKVGNARDARTAHAIAAHAYNAVEAYERDVWRAQDEWYDNMQEGEKPEFKLTEAYADYLPTGWRVLGRGAYRVTFLSPKGVVYKVNRGLYDSYNGNGVEMKSIVKVKASGLVPSGWAVPDATLYRIPVVGRYGDEEDTVTAMPLIDTSAPLSGCSGYKCKCNNSAGNQRLVSKHPLCTADAFYEGSRVFFDLHEGNVFPDREGTLWVIDVCVPT